jgi:hypothetical protein
MAIVHKDGMSTAVRIRLEVSGTVLRVAQVGDDTLILRTECKLAPVEYARLIISVDGEEIVYPVALPDGIESREVRFSDAPFCDVAIEHGGDPNSGPECPF